jgi:hypothetical protein
MQRPFSVSSLTQKQQSVLHKLRAQHAALHLLCHGHRVPIPLMQQIGDADEQGLLEVCFPNLVGLLAV